MVMAQGCCGGASAAKSQAEPAGALTVKDPVCGMTVDPAAIAHHAEHDGRAYSFCSAGCRTKFVADPEQYLGTSVGKAGCGCGSSAAKSRFRSHAARASRRTSSMTEAA